MFTNFIGYHLVEEYHKWKKERRRKGKDVHISRAIKIAVVVAVCLAIWLMPTSAFGIAGLTIIQKRVIAIFAFAALMWILEVVSSWTTSVFVVAMLLVTVSDSSLWLFDNAPAETLGTQVSYVSILHCFADPTIMLFIGGFILAIAATKTGLDGLLARVLLKPFGTKPKYVLLGFILVTGFFSMFLSNTATAAMMLTFLTPVLKSMEGEGKGKAGLALAIPMGANIGGIATPIGTPPNAIALKYLNDPAGMNMNIGFGEWVGFMLPFAVLMMILAWLLLLWLFPFKHDKIELKIESEAKKDWRSIIVYITFAITILLWMTDKFTGMNANAVAMIPVGVLSIVGVITKRDLEEINWGVLWMVAGGFALGVALQESGLGKALVSSIPFANWTPILVIVGSGLICYLMANFISHSATAALLVPILALAGASMGDTLAPVGGVSTLLIGVALGSSLAMVLPISTPPNALAHSTGMIEQKDMEKVGILVGILGLVLGYTMLILLGSNGMI